jgi:aminoglycoside 3-N-acetyltransferase
VHKTLYYVGRRLISEQRRERLKATHARGRKKLWPLIRIVNGGFDSVALRAELMQRLPAAFDVLMVHCSYDDMLPMYSEGVGHLLTVLRDLCGAERTLVMPAFTYLAAEGDLAGYFAAHPRFDARRQPSQMGLLSEVFRRTPGVLRSLHPTHSVCALGPLAASITAEHHLGGTTFGVRSPFARMAELDTVILGLGKPYYRVLTQIHAAEDLLGDRFPLPRAFREVEMVLVDGKTEHPYRFWADLNPINGRLDRLPSMLAPGDLNEWRFHGVPLFWTRAGRVTDVLVEAGRRGKTLYAGPTLV